MTKPSEQFTPADLFEFVWDILVDVLGTATTATLFQRAARHAELLRPGLQGLRGFEITRTRQVFDYVLPAAWQSPLPESREALEVLVRDALCPLLRELTGAVIIDLLERQPELRGQSILPQNGASS